MQFGNNDRCIEEYFPGAKQEHFTNVGTDIDSYLYKEYGPGSSGYFAGSYTKSNSTGSKIRTGGHAIHWAFDNNGNIRVSDGQNGKIFNSLNDACNEYGFDRKGGSNVYRLDNVSPDINKLINDGMIQPGWNRIDGQTTSQAYKSKFRDGSDLDMHKGDYGMARSEAKSDLYDAYKEYKKQYFN